MTKSSSTPPDTDPDTSSQSPHQPSNIFLIAPNIDNQTLLAYACESLASANVMASDFARYLQGSQSNTLLGIQQSIMLGELAVNRVLDNLDPP
ncbi:MULTISPECIES: DUF6124 family protein [unclassified Pseudomonas]|jgi:hypothetical protein|uniref:DUF6124 family protein n=1 Tax=unclassified Pseudomonas TaxID=196821 RepID=UPI00070296D4|nr:MULTISPECIES: DUF6124 family protein [unclassified Pseudomonas]KQZ81708.1 hypothetical protein ASD60_11100 [Pseudomonas sp. Root562]